MSMYLDPIDAWYVRNTGRPLTPSGVESGDPDKPRDLRFIPWRSEAFDEYTARTRAAAMGPKVEEARPPLPGRPEREPLRVRDPLLGDNVTIGPATEIRNPYDSTPRWGEKDVDRWTGRAGTDEEGNRGKARDWQREQNRKDAAAKQARQAAELRAMREEKRTQWKRGVAARAAEAQRRVEVRLAETVRRRNFQSAQSRAAQANIARGGQIKLTPEQIAAAEKDWWSRRGDPNAQAALMPSWARNAEARIPQLYSDSRVAGGIGYMNGRPIFDPGGPTGGRTTQDLSFGRARERVTWGRPLYVEGAQAQYAFTNRLNRQQINDLQVKLANAGLLDLSKAQRGVYGADTIRAMAKAMGNANITGSTVEQYLSNIPGQSALSSPYAGGDGSRGRGPLSTKDIQKVFDLTSIDQGAAVLRQVLAQQLGRQPTDSEIKNYVAQLNAKERKNPDIITTIATSNASGSITTSQQIREGKKPEADEEALRFSKGTGTKQERQDFQEGMYYEALASLMGVE